MATLTIQKKLSAVTEQITSAEQLETVFNNPETYRKVCQIRETRKKGDLKKANSIKNSLEGLIFVADDFAECEKPVNIVANGKKQEVMEPWQVATAEVGAPERTCRARCGSLGTGPSRAVPSVVG